MKNKLIDLNDHLFAQLERLSDEELTPEQLQKEVERSQAVIKVGDVIVSNANTILKAAEFQAEYSGRQANIPKMLSNDNGDDLDR